MGFIQPPVLFGSTCPLPINQAIQRLLGMFGRWTDWRRTSDLLERDGDLSGLGGSGFGVSQTCTVLMLQGCQRSPPRPQDPSPGLLPLVHRDRSFPASSKAASDLQLKGPFYEYVDCPSRFRFPVKAAWVRGGSTVSIFGGFINQALDGFTNSKVNAITCYAKAARSIVPIRGLLDALP